MVNARLAEFGDLNDRLERMELMQREEEAVRRRFLRAWGAAVVVAVPVGTVILQHFVH
jgi:hypothetical protein